MTVANVDVAIIEYKGQRVLTTEQVAEVYACDKHNIQKNYNENKERFTLGKHFYKLEGAELKAFKDQFTNSDLVACNASSLMLWTRQGASRHCKMLGTDQAWDMFDCLEENYFNPKPIIKPMNQFEIMAESVRILQEHDNRIKQVELAQAEQKKELQDIREVITLRPDSWRDGTKTILDKIAIALGGDSEAFKDVRNQSYTELEKRAHCRLGLQLKNAKKRMEEKGASKTEINSLRILDMIDKNQRLIEIYLSVVKDMAINHGVNLDDVLF
jgi:hypothetical protein